MRRVIAAALIVGLSSPVFADELVVTSLSRSIDKASFVADQILTSKPPPSEKNTMLWPGIGLIAAGGLMAAVGFTRVTGFECDFDSCQDTHQTGLGYAGLGIAALGAVLLWRGQPRAAPSVQIGPKRASVNHTISF
jgi:hypothetical protein